MVLWDTNGGKEININDILVVEGFAMSQLAHMYSFEAGQASVGNNTPSFQTGSTLNVPNITPHVAGATSLAGSDILNLLQSLAICYAQNPQLNQQHFQNEIINPFFNVPSNVNTGSPNVQMNLLSNGTRLVNHFPIFPLSDPSAYGANIPGYANLPVAEHNSQYMKPETAPFCVKEVKEMKKSADDSERPKMGENINDSTGKLKSIEKFEELQQCHEKALLHIKGIKEVYKHF
ncbi:uncharacterized protein LOC118205905 [Stegodyphus dumicola]|uniref:uncharacterized protein LOC118205905 n=1 Tax=Stegodyphus dumicola TaxID=202533 RepID=UPI0015B2F00C|nr:uncharacterized protein LOC118205905 [Stegodyphus dumicola]XP_035234067.1 uncharacterized protein LOC118205905 [Stegodyphus dumicola]